MQTYEGKLHGDRIRWKGEAPLAVNSEADLDVIVTIVENISHQNGLRPFGLAKGEFVVAADFDSSLPDELLDSFEN